MPPKKRKRKSSSIFMTQAKRQKYYANKFYTISEIVGKFKKVLNSEKNNIGHTEIQQIGCYELFNYTLIH